MEFKILGFNSVVGSVRLLELEFGILNIGISHKGLEFGILNIGISHKGLEFGILNIGISHKGLKF